MREKIRPEAELKAVVEEPSKVREDLATEAAGVLRRNDMGGWTRPASGLYPHQWSWDSAFIAIGLAHLDLRRAAQEMWTLFASQWKTGKVPHIVFNPEAPPESYFPGPEHWACAAASSDTPPSSPYTSCLCQPPVHALAVSRIWEVARNQDRGGLVWPFLHEIFPKLFAWHRYLMTYRDPERSGLVTIYHPWESGTDNSPRWDAALSGVEVGSVGSYPRRDLQHVVSSSERPTDEDYERYLWLTGLIKRSFCDEGEIHRSHPFLVQDVLFSSILVWANEALLELAHLVHAPRCEIDLISSWIRRGRWGLESLWDRNHGLYLDYDLKNGRPLEARTIAGLAPLVAGGMKPSRSTALLEQLHSPRFAGHGVLRWPLPPVTSPEDEAFDPRSYWRGPVWPVMNWILWRGLLRAGEPEMAERLRLAALEQVSGGGFGEYFEPFTGETLGAGDQSWTAAVTLDWLSGYAADGVSRVAA
jgi:hypothetical protein